MVNACSILYPYDKICHFSTLITLRPRWTYTSLETWKSTICSIFERMFLFKNLPVTHVHQATIFACQTVKFYRSVSGTYFEACSCGIMLWLSNQSSRSEATCLPHDGRIREANLNICEIIKTCFRQLKQDN